MLQAEAGGCRVASAFVTYRSKDGYMDTYVGSSDYRLVAAADRGLRIRHKRCVLDLESLRPQGRVSILL